MKRKKNFQQEVLRKLNQMVKLLAIWYGQNQNINLKKRIQTLDKIGLNETAISTITNKPIIIIKTMKGGKNDK